MAVITKTQLENAAIDVVAIEEFANGAEDLGGDGLVHPRLGGNIKTLAKIQSDAETDIALTISNLSDPIMLADSDYPSIALIFTLTNITNLKAYTGSSVLVFSQGYSSAGDGGEGLFLWDPASTATADDYFVVAKTGHAGAGRWIRQHKGFVYAEIFGAVGDNSTDDSTAIETAINSCRAAGVELRGRKDKVYYIDSTAGMDFTVVGTYQIRDLVLRGSPSISTHINFMDFIGPVKDSAAPLLANAALGSTTVVIDSANAANYVAGTRVLLHTDKNYHTHPGANGKISDFGRVKSVAADTPSSGQTTITLGGAIQSSFNTADSATLYRNQETMIVKMIDCKIYLDTPIVSTTSISANAIYAYYCKFYATRCVFDGWSNSAISLHVCYDSVLDRCEGRNALYPGTGYAFVIAGCDRPNLISCHGYNVRHIVPVGASGGAEYILGRNAVITGTTGELIRDSGIDSHPGQVGAIITNSAFSCTETAESIATLQGCDLQIGDITVDGAQGSGVLIQNFGRPADEGPNFVTLGNIGGGYNPTTNPLVHMESYDTTDSTSLIVTGGHIFGNWTTGVTAADNGDASRGGDIHFNFKSVSAMRGADSIRIDNRSAYRQITGLVDRLVVKNDNSNAYAAYCYDINVAPAISETLTLSGNTVGVGRTATSGGAIFENKFVGGVLEEIAGSGVATITGITSSTVATIEITTEFSGTSITSTDWKITTPYLKSRLTILEGTSEAESGVYHFRTIASKIDLGESFTLLGEGGNSVVTGSGGVFKNGVAV